jgi:hypothetical protein
MGIPVLDGREFTLADVGGAPVVLVNETLVRRSSRIGIRWAAGARSSSAAKRRRGSPSSAS